MESRQSLKVIHIGKCGGSTVCDAIKKSSLIKEKYKEIEIFHMRKAIYDKNSDYLIIIRHPIERALSAFNWRYHLLVNKNNWKSFSPEYEHEKEILRRYKSINNISEKLYHKNGKANARVHQELREVYHIKLGTSYYLKELML